MKTMDSEKNMSIFIVDDDYFCRQLYCQFLFAAGYKNVFAFEKGEDCIYNLCLQPDLIILDYNMEPQNGLDLLKKIKLFMPNAYALLISGQREVKVAINAIKYGAYQYIAKDDQMLSILGNTLDEIERLVTRQSDSLSTNSISVN